MIFRRDSKLDYIPLKRAALLLFLGGGSFLSSKFIYIQLHHICIGLFLYSAKKDNSKVFLKSLYVGYMQIPNSVFSSVLVQTSF